MAFLFHYNFPKSHPYYSVWTPNLTISSLFYFQGWKFPALFYSIFHSIQAFNVYSEERLCLLEFWTANSNELSIVYLNILSIDFYLCFALIVEVVVLLIGKRAKFTTIKSFCFWSQRFIRFHFTEKSEVNHSIWAFHFEESKLYCLWSNTFVLNPPRNIIHSRYLMT